MFLRSAQVIVALSLWRGRVGQLLCRGYSQFFWRGVTKGMDSFQEAGSLGLLKGSCFPLTSLCCLSDWGGSFFALLRALAGALRVHYTALTKPCY